VPFAMRTGARASEGCTAAASVFGAAAYYECVR
jgi:hypothetical protein